MKNLVTALIAVVCIVAGGVVGHFLKGMLGGSEAAAASSPAQIALEAETKAKTSAKGGNGHGGKDAAKAQGGGHAGDAYGSGSSGSTTYYKFSREFVVPVLRGGRVKSLVILNINLEVDQKISGDLFSLDPKLRDNIMTTLITLSNDGHTFETITDVESYETVRSMILMNLKNVVPEGVQNVLILDMAKQDV